MKWRYGVYSSVRFDFLSCTARACFILLQTTQLPVSTGRSAANLTRSARKPCRRLVESSPEKSRGSRRFHRPLDRKPGITVEHGGYTPPHEAAGTKQTDVGGWVLRTQHHSSETVVVLAAGRTLGRRQQHTRRESETEEEVAGAAATLAGELGFS